MGIYTVPALVDQIKLLDQHERASRHHHEHHERFERERGGERTRQERKKFDCVGEKIKRDTAIEIDLGAPAWRVFFSLHFHRTALTVRRSRSGMYRQIGLASCVCFVKKKNRKKQYLFIYFIRCPSLPPITFCCHV